MTEDIIIVQISSPIFTGFRIKFDRNLFLSLTEIEIVFYCKESMKDFFSSNNLYKLAEKCDKLKLHFHEDIKNPEKIVYLCSHFTEE